MKKITLLIAFLILGFSPLKAQEAPPNDTCDGAIELTVFNSTCDTPTVGDNTNATDSGIGNPSCADVNQGDLWYKITVPESGYVTIETSAVEGSNLTDTAMAVYEGPCEDLTEIACNDDFGGSSFAKIELAGLTPGEVLYIRVFFVYAGMVGEFNICAYDPDPAASPKYNLAKEINIFPNPFNKNLNISSDYIIDEIHIYNITGREVLKARPESTHYSFRTGDLQPGIYLIKVISNDSSATLKLIKK